MLPPTGSENTFIARRAFVWKTFKKWCPFVCPYGDFAIFAFTVLTWDTKTGCYCLLKQLKVLILEPSSLNFLQAKLYRLFFNFFQKLQKSPGVVSRGKTQKSEQKDPFPQCKNVQKYIFLETRTLDLLQIDVTEHHLLNSSTQEPWGPPLPCGCNLVIMSTFIKNNVVLMSEALSSKLCSFHF